MTKAVLLKLLQYSQESMCAGVPSTRWHATILKRDSKQVFSCQYCKIKKKLFWRTSANGCFFNPLSANPTKWSNTLKQFVGKLAMNCLSRFDHFVKLALKGLIFTQDVFSLCQQYGGRGSEDVYVDTSPIKHLRWSFLSKKPVAIFLKSSISCLKYV